MAKKPLHKNEEFTAEGFEFQGTQPLTDEEYQEQINQYHETLEHTAFRKENYVTNQEYAKILIDNVAAEKQWFDGTKFVLEELKNLGEEIAINDRDVEEMLKVAGDMFKIRYYRQLIHATGLSPFEDKIMSHLIDRFFQSKVILNPGASIPPRQVSKSQLPKG